MSLIEAFILGLIQGLSEFLPISSSGHIELAKALFGIEVKDDASFTIILHGGTVLSTIAVFRKEIWSLLKALLSFEWNEDVQYIAKLAASLIPLAPNRRRSTSQYLSFRGHEKQLLSEICKSIKPSHAQVVPDVLARVRKNCRLACTNHQLFQSTGAPHPNIHGFAYMRNNFCRKSVNSYSPPMPGWSQMCWPVLARAGPCWPVLAHVGPRWPVLARAGPCWPVLAHVGPC